MAPAGQTSLSVVRGPRRQGSWPRPAPPTPCASCSVMAGPSFSLHEVTSRRSPTMSLSGTKDALSVPGRSILIQKRPACTALLLQHAGFAGRGIDNHPEIVDAAPYGTCPGLSPGYGQDAHVLGRLSAGKLCTVRPEPARAGSGLSRQFRSSFRRPFQHRLVASAKVRAQVSQDAACSRKTQSSLMAANLTTNSGGHAPAAHS